jgi:hypothetical protein
MLFAKKRAFRSLIFVACMVEVEIWMAVPDSAALKELQETFTPEQKEYLAGFLLAVANRGETFFVGSSAA